MKPEWMRLASEEEVRSPALLVYRDRLQINLDRMVAMVGDPARLRPHLKTHKTPQIVAMQVERGITKCKCATIAEAEMAAAAGATDVLLATQPVGPNVERLVGLIGAFPSTRFRTIVDDHGIGRALSAAAAAEGRTVDVLVDLDVGYHRTGIAPGPAALELCHFLTTLSGIAFVGLHAYDGHITDSDLAERTRAVEAAFQPVIELRDRLVDGGLDDLLLVAGGTPSFPIHAGNVQVECSPGTCVLWDARSSTHFPDLDFLYAAVLLTRVISRPGIDRLCLDLGHKAVASEMPHPRVLLPALPDAVPVIHSEEHLVLQTSLAGDFPVGSVLYGIPWHICPTVALHQSLHVVDEGRVTAEWSVAARRRRLNI